MKHGVTHYRLNPQSPFAKGLVGCWIMGNAACWGSSTLIDLSPYQNHGTLQSMDPQTDWVHDGERAGLDFDGVDDSCQLNGVPYLTRYSISIWCFSLTAPSTASYGGPIHREKQWQFNWDHSTSGKLGSFQHNDSTGAKWVKMGNLPVNTWIHLVASYDGVNIVVYNNGMEAGSVAAGDPIDDGSTATIGKHAIANYWWDGRVDLLLIHNRALTASEVAQLYNETRDGSYGSLLIPEPHPRLHFTTSSGRQLVTCAGT